MNGTIRRVNVGPLVAAAVAAAVWVMAGVSFAEPPPVYDCTLSCYGTANAGGTGASRNPWYLCTISPDGGSPSEDIHVEAVIKNVLGYPIEGATVVCTAVGLNGAVFIWDGGAPPGGDTDMDPQTKLSLAGGHADFLYDQGGVRIDGEVVGPTLNFDVLVTASPRPGVCERLPICQPALTVIGFDMDANCLVDGLDLGRFTATWTTEDQKGDFNFDWTVDGLDLGLLTAHWNKSCDSQ